MEERGPSTTRGDFIFKENPRILCTETKFWAPSHQYSLRCSPETSPTHPPLKDGPSFTAMSEHRVVVRKLYRELLTRIRRLPPKDQVGKIEEAVRTMRANRDVEDEAKRSALLKDLVARVSFLRVVTPRRPGDGNVTGTKYVIRDGELVEGEGDSFGLRVASSQISMNDYRVRHEQLLKRQHFGRSAPAYDPSTF